MSMSGRRPFDTSPGARVIGFARSCGFAILVTSLAGCIPSADLPDPALDVPDTFRASGPGKPADAPRVDWWVSFRTPELTGFMEETALANLDIAAAAARIIQADANARVTGAVLFPLINAVDSVTRSRQPALSTTNVTERTVYLTSFTASYEIDFWRKNESALRAAEQSAFASRWDRETIAITALAGTANTYFAILSARERLRYVNENLRAATRILDLIKERVTVGTATALDQAQQESLVANVRATIPPLKQIADQNVATLAVLLGRAPERLTVAGSAVTAVGLPRVSPGLPSDVLLQRPDIQFAEAQLLSANASLQSARAAFFPSIQLTAQGGWQSLALQSLFSPSSAFYSVAAGLTQPIFDGGRLYGAFDQQKGRQEEFLANYRKSVISAFSDVERALVALQQLAQQEELLRQALAASRRAYEISEVRLREGTVDIVSVLQTQQTLFTAQDTLLQVRLSRLQAAVALYQALGGGWAHLRLGSHI